MYKKFVVYIFSTFCCLINSIYVNAGEKYYCIDNPYSYSQYSFNNLGSYILVNTISNENIQNSASNCNETLENLSNEDNTENDSDNNQIIITPQEQELWLKTYSDAAVMNMITDKCVSLLDIYKLAFNNKANVNNLSDTDKISNSKNKLAKILLQLQKSNTQIFIPDLVLAINEANQISEIQPLAYIDDILYSYNSPDTLIIYFHTNQLVKNSKYPVPEIYIIEDKDTKISTKKINDRNVVYKINFLTMDYTLILHTADGENIRINEAIQLPF